MKYPPTLKDKAIPLRAQGMSYRQIGEALGAPLQTVRVWCQHVPKLRVPGFSVLSLDQIADIRRNTKSYDSDYSIRAQSEEYGVHYDTIRRIIGRVK